MHVTGDIACPPIEIPKWSHVEGIPAATDQRGRAIIVIDKLELSAMECEMTQKLGVAWLFHDLEGQETHRRYLRHSLLKNQAIAENTFSRRTDECALASRRKRTRQSHLVKPIIRGGVDRRKRDNVVPHLVGRSIDASAVLDDMPSILPHFTFRS